MDKSITDFVVTARNKGLNDEEIRKRLLHAGWTAHEVYVATEQDPELVPPAPSGNKTEDHGKERHKESMNVMSGGFSGSGFEYLIYFLALGIVALASASMMHSIINVVIDTAKFSFYQDVIPFSTAALVVVAPIYLWLMLRLRKKETQTPEILADPSRRRAVQFLLFVTFVIGLIKLIAYVFNIINIAGGAPGDTNLVAETLHAIVTIGVAGGIFWKYFQEQSKVE